MNTPLWCVDNLFNEFIYTGHTVTANEEATGFDAWKVATGRRSADDFWKPTTANNDAWVEVACDRTRAADFIAIDRGHNLAGQTVALQISDNDFTDTEDVFSITFPSSYFPGSDITATNGARTEEGAWVKTFDLRAAKYWRLHITAAATYTPNVVGLWVGKKWSPGEYMARPWDDGAVEVSYAAPRTPAGWVGAGELAEVRVGDWTVRVPSYFAEDAARRFAQTYQRRRPAWYVPNPDQAERAVLTTIPPNGRITLPYGDDWGFRTLRAPFMELGPRRAD
jgi:hypothetical protein